jgi:hypothetical protein
MAYRGSVTRLPVGMLGLSGSRNPTQLQAGNFKTCEGVSLDGGLIQKLGGVNKQNAVALGAPSIILAGINYSPLSSVTRDAVFLTSGTVRKDSGTNTFPTTLVTGLVATDRAPPPYFMMAGGESAGAPRTLFMFSASNQVQAVDGDGAVMASITGPAADWAGAGNFPTFGILHEGRLWGGGNASDPHRMYYSTLADHQNISGGGTLAVHPGEGERLVGGISFSGLLILFKYPKGVYAIETSDPSPAGWRVTRLSSAVGGISQHAIVPIDNDTLYMDSGGNIQLLSATNAFGGVQTANLSQRAEIAQWMRDNIDLVNIRRAVGVWYGTKQQAIFALPKKNGTGDNTVQLMIDFSNPQVGPRFLTTERDTPISMWTRPDTFGVYKPVHGDNAGFIWLMDQISRNKAGAGYDFKFETADMDLSFIDPKMATLNKTGDFLEIIFEPQGDWDLVVQVIWDDVPGPPIMYAMGGDGAPLGSFTLDVDVLASTAIRSIRKRIAGSGRRLRLAVSNSGIDQNVALSDFILSFRAMDERVRANA